MELDANDLILFARVADAGSFSRAAEQFRLEKSTVSRRIAALEERFGERLLHRTTRKLTLTDFGISLLDHARALAAEVDGALALAQHRQATPSGRLRVSLPSDFASVYLHSMLAQFAREHPTIVLELDLSSRRVDLIGENFDLAVRIGRLPDDSQLAARKLAEVSAGLYAAPSYLKEAGEPHEPDDLLDLHGLLSQTRTGEARGWTLVRDASDAVKQWRGVPARHTIANSPAILMRMAQAGFGVVCLPDMFARDAVQRGTLARLLPDWNLPTSPFWAVFPGRRLMPSRTRAFIEALVATMGDGTTDLPEPAND
ncbi:bacterial regulatory helix-turn-helix, lysR family protein [Burkholderia cenocepacia]|uniref:Bacterial regulatory helix-turn-helix, lysR family protein n=1 Tax=Burkholderia cenocepacia TaxID=95486 RepID=A0AAN0RPX2_9BURK|nr:bacterial regulatory helix-turn-helix, lysR family protein [Burkholderia cenocepacia]